MNILNEIRRLRKLYPNDSDFGSKVARYLELNKTCCDDENNYKEEYIKDIGPYGYYGWQTSCKKCGKIIDFKEDRS